jgi:hypothetical protein
MKTILQFALVLLLFAGTFAAGYYLGQMKTNEQLSAEIVEHVAERDTLVRKYERIVTQQLKERKYYEERINANYGSSAFVKFQIILQSMDAPDGQR